VNYSLVKQHYVSVKINIHNIIIPVGLRHYPFLKMEWKLTVRSQGANIFVYILIYKQIAPTELKHIMNSKSLYRENHEPIMYM